MRYLKKILEIEKPILVFVLLMFIGLFNVFNYIQYYSIGIQIFRIQLVDLAIISTVVTHLFYVFISKKVYIHAHISFLRYYLIYIGYSLLSMFFLLRFPYHPLYGIFSFYTVFTYFLINIVLYIDYKKSELNFQLIISFIEKVFKWSFIPVWILAIIQFLLNDDLISLNTDEKTLQVKSELMGTFRPRSIFNSSYEFGLFSCVVAAYFLPLIKNKNKINLHHLLFFLMGLSGVVLCQTRNVYFIGGFTLLTSLLLTGWPHSIKLMRALPWVYVVIMFFILFYLGFQAVSGDLMSNLMSNESTFVRFSLLYSLLNELIAKGNIFDYLFGWGLIQHMGDTNLGWLYPDVYNIDDGTFGVDNTFMAIFIYQGIIGLILYLTVYVKILYFLIADLSVKRDNFNLFAASLFICFPSAGVFNLVHVGFWGNLIWFLAGLSMIRIYRDSAKNSLIVSQI